MMSHFSSTSPSVAHILLAAVVGASIAAPAQAATIQASDLPDGAASVTLDDFATVTASVRTFKTKFIPALPDFRGVGIAGGYINGEIDAQDSEAIEIQFANPEGEKIDFFDVAFLFRQRAYEDTANEIAIVTPTGSTSGFLSVINENSARWQFGSTTFDAINLSSGSRAGAGAWRVLNPFGDVATQSLRFSSPNGRSGTDPDYSLLRVETAPQPVKVPEAAATLGLLTIVGWGAGSLKRRFAAVETKN